jgi:hypothetical protein
MQLADPGLPVLEVHRGHRYPEGDFVFMSITPITSPISTVTLVSTKPFTRPSRTLRGCHTLHPPSLFQLLLHADQPLVLQLQLLHHLHHHLLLGVHGGAGKHARSRRCSKTPDVGAKPTNTGVRPSSSR